MQQMLSESRYDDDRYAARFAASKMGEETLSWYLELDDDTQDSWRLLSRAIMREFGRQAETSLAPLVKFHLHMHY